MSWAESYFQQQQASLLGHTLPWLTALRAREIKPFLQNGFPKRQQEDWKYTDLSSLQKATFALAKLSANTIDKAFIENLRLPNSYVFVFVDGYFAVELSDQHAAVMSLQTALDMHEHTLQAALTQTSVFKYNALAQLNTAWFTDGLFIQIPAQSVIDKPIQILSITTQQSTAHMYHPRHIIYAGAGSQATIIEQHLATTETVYFKNTLTQIIVGNNAQLNYYKIQQEADQASHIGNTYIQQQRDSQVNSLSISLGACLSRDDLQVALSEENAQCCLNGLYILTNEQHNDHHTRIEHLVPHCTSSENYKGILAGKSTGVFNGKIIVHPHAEKTNSQQSNKNLLLSSTANINTKPELEIYADDVKCAHGTTVGQLDQDALFYLRSRGIALETAMELLTYAFASEILTNINSDEIVQYIEKVITQKLKQTLREDG
jgi:Fe-S cluster assembly protein SufD